MRSDKHNWNPIVNYIHLHETMSEEHDFVVPGQHLSYLFAEIPEHPTYDKLTVEGCLRLLNGAVLEVAKWGDVERTPQQRVRMTAYNYAAYIPGEASLLRYDNMHILEPEVFDRHEYDPVTGTEIAFKELTRLELPVMHEIIDEIEHLFPTL